MKPSHIFLWALLVQTTLSSTQQEERPPSSKATVSNIIDSDNNDNDNNDNKHLQTPVVRMNKHGIHVLNERNFDAFIEGSITKTSRRGVFVKFYSPWCAHCKELEKPWQAIAKACELYPVTQNSSAMDTVVVGSFDCDTGPQSHKFCKDQLKITGFPTIHYYEGLEYNRQYLGTRSFKDLIIFVEWETGLHFPFLTGTRRFKATAFRLLCELMQFSMSSHGEDGAKPSGKALVTFAVLVTIPVLLLFASCIAVGWCCCISKEARQNSALTTNPMDEHAAMVPETATPETSKNTTTNTTRSGKKKKKKKKSSTGSDSKKKKQH